MCRKVSVHYAPSSDSVVALEVEANGQLEVANNVGYDIAFVS